ncbi:MAG: restriction endonuclease subunit S [Pseudomonadota bacterium]
MAIVFEDIPIGQLCTKVTTGSTPLRSRQDYYEAGTFDWYKTGELKDWYLEAAEERITEKAFDETSVKLFPAETVLMAMYGDGKTITSLGMLRSPAATNQACSAMIVDERKCSARYFFYALKARRHVLLKMAYGGAQRNLTGKLIREFPLPVPSLPNQQRIAGILSAYDELIENNKRRIRVLEEIARTLYREWFINSRDQSTAKYTFGDLCELMKEPFNELVHADRRLLDLSRIPQRFIAPLETADPGELKTSRIVFEPGDTLFGAIRCYLHKVVTAPFPGVTNTSVFVLRPKKWIFRSLTAIVASELETIRWAETHSSGMKMPVLSWSVFRTMPIPLSSEASAQRYESIVGAMLETIGVLARAIQSLRQTRDLLLPRLLAEAPIPEDET